MMIRSHFSTHDSIAYIWNALGLPSSFLGSDLPNLLSLSEVDEIVIPSSFKIGHIAQASIALSAATAALVQQQHLHPHTSLQVPTVTVPLRHALLEFNSEKYLTIDGRKVESNHIPIGGLYKTSDGYVRVHDAFPNHRQGAKKLLGISDGIDSCETIARALKVWKAADFETAGQETGLSVASCLRSPDQWDRSPQAASVADMPILLRALQYGENVVSSTPHFRLGKAGATKCLHGLRVIEMTRVIAAPVAGKTLAAHGADVLWVTSPNLPDLPSLDRDMSRGKRTIQLDLDNSAEDKARLLELLRDADVFIQSYRPGSLAAKGLSEEVLVKMSKNGIVIANLSAYGASGPWSTRRGFDSLVQTCTGMNVSEAEHHGKGEDAKPMPCQALDHASGYFLATGINAALYKRATLGGSWIVDVSLAGTMKYLRSLGQYEGDRGFLYEGLPSPGSVDEQFLEDKQSKFGKLRALRHSANVKGRDVGWEIMPKPLGMDEAIWLD